VRLCSTPWAEYGKSEVIVELPAMSGFDQVHVASTASEPNLPKPHFAGTLLEEIGIA